MNTTLEEMLEIQKSKGHSHAGEDFALNLTVAARSTIEDSRFSFPYVLLIVAG
ncbi:MAG: hypothetical protein K0Q81_245 [Paenibacillus sp.]|jgi:hypothetical protein|nr:hypothetical protein [Paenibacillus sp.]